MMTQRTGFKRLLGDIYDLFELQFELFAVDGKKAFKAGFMSVVFLSLAVAMAISTLTIFLAALAWFINAALNWSPGMALLSAAGIGLVVSLGLLAATYGAIKYACSSLEETRSEFVQNLSWVKALILGDRSTTQPPLNPFDKEAVELNAGRGADFSPQAPKWDPSNRW